MAGRLIITPYNIELETQQPVHYQGHPITGFNLAPKQPLSILRLSEQLELVQALWAFTPQWLDDFQKAPFILRQETLLTNNRYQQHLVQQRCLLPVTGYYLWKQINHKKQPFALRKAANRPFFLAALWTRYQLDKKTYHDSFALISRPAPNEYRFLTERMPSLIAHEDITLWLDQQHEPQQALQLLDQHVIQLEYYPVSHQVNSLNQTGVQVTHPIGARRYPR